MKVRLRDEIPEQEPGITFWLTREGNRVYIRAVGDDGKEQTIGAFESDSSNPDQLSFMRFSLGAASDVFQLLATTEERRIQLSR